MDGCAPSAVGSGAFEAFFEATGDLLCIADGSGRLTWVSPSWERQLGWPASAVLGRPWTDGVHLADRAAADAAAAALARGEPVRRCRLHFARQGGGPRLLECSLVPSGGTIHGIARVVGDDDVLQQEAVFRAAFRASRIDLAIASLHGDRIEAVNGMFSSMVARAAEDLEGQPVDALVAPEFRVQCALARAALLSDGVCGPLRGILLRADGTRVSVLIRGWRFGDAGETAHVLYSFEWIGERERLEAALREERDFLSAVMDTSASAVLVCDATGRIEFSNSAAESLLAGDGTAAGTVRQFLAEGRLRRADGTPLPETERPLRRVLDTGETVRDARFAVETADGSRRVLSVNAALLQGERAAPRIVKTITDITAETDYRAALEEEVRQRTAELEQALARQQQINAFQRRFVSVVSHEFRTPLAIIDASAHRTARVLARGEPERAGDYLGKIGAAVQRLTGILEAVLETAKLQQGEIELDPRPFALAEVLREAVALQAEISPHMQLRIEAESEPEVVADRRLVFQIVTNMLSNAVKYSGNATEAIARLAQTGDTAVLSVQDFGVGVAPDEIGNLFHPFFRASTAEGVPGTGLGLNLSKTLARLHGGDLHFASTLGEGSVITLTLPLRAPSDGNRS